jgi:lipid A 3-O-deacylase
VNRKPGILHWACVSATLILWVASCLPAEGSDPALIGPVAVLGDSPHQIDVGLGTLGLRHDLDQHSQAERIELRIGKKIAYVGPAVGLLANRDVIRYVYGGIYADFTCGKFVLTPVLAIGWFRNASNLDLGGPLEFRESLEVAYRLSGRWRIGVSIAHISNADIYEKNPGQEDLLITCAVGF